MLHQHDLRDAGAGCSEKREYVHRHKRLALMPAGILTGQETGWARSQGGSDSATRGTSRRSSTRIQRGNRDHAGWPAYEVLVRHRIRTT